MTGLIVNQDVQHVFELTCVIFTLPSVSIDRPSTVHRNVGSSNAKPLAMFWGEVALGTTDVHLREQACSLTLQ